MNAQCTFLTCHTSLTATAAPPVRFENETVASLPLASILGGIIDSTQAPAWWGIALPICRLIGLALLSWRCSSANTTANLAGHCGRILGAWAKHRLRVAACRATKLALPSLQPGLVSADVVGAFTRLARLSQSAKASRFHASGACKYGLNSVADEREQAQSLLSPSFARKDKQAHQHSNSVYASAPAANSGSRGKLRDFTALSRHPVPLAAGWYTRSCRCA